VLLFAHRLGVFGLPPFGFVHVPPHGLQKQLLVAGAFLWLKKQCLCAFLAPRAPDLVRDVLLVRGVVERRPAIFPRNAY
jgi:hypothetical protein